MESLCSCPTSMESLRSCEQVAGKLVYRCSKMQTVNGGGPNACRALNTMLRICTFLLLLVKIDFVHVCLYVAWIGAEDFSTSIM